MAPRWTKEQVEKLRTMATAGHSGDEIAAAVQRTLQAVHDYTHKHRIPLREGEAIPDPIAAAQARIERISALKTERDALTAVAGERSLRAMLESAVRGVVALASAPSAYKEPKRARGVQVTRETLVLKLSDWHWGETIDPEGTRGHNAYDTGIAARRVGHVVDTARDLARRLRVGGWEFPRLVVAANGDFVSGTIHELEKHSDDRSIVESVYGCGMRLAEALRDLAADFPSVDVYCTAGNHGRLPDARRVQQKDPTRSWDTLVYLFAQTALRDVPNVRFFIPASYAVAYDIEGWTVLQQHGHDIKSWNGIPWYGINRAVANISALEAARDRRIAYYFVSHFHQNTSLPHAGGEMFVNGSLCGGTEFTINALGKSDRPCQWLLAFHAEHGVTHRWPLWAEPAKRSATAA